MKTFFFLNDKLHKKISIIKSEDIIVAWDFPEEKRTWYNYTLVKKQYENAYTIDEVAQLIERPATQIKDLVNRRLIERPSGMSYTIISRKPMKYYWSEQDILNMRDRFFEMARKNKHGEPFSNFQLISKAELLAKMREENALYIKSDGKFVKVWKNV